jgi:MFS family permease
MFTILGSFLCAGATSTAFLFAGRFFTGIGVGNLSATGPVYNAELAPPEVRGLLVSMQQLAITIGIMLAYWISYGSNNIGGTGPGQSDWAWRTPMLCQGIPAIFLAVGVWFLPYSPRWLVKQDRDQEALASLCKLRGRPVEDRLVQIEFLEIKAEDEFERRAFVKRFPLLSEKSRQNQWIRELMSYLHFFRTKDSFKRVAIASCIMFFQQWSGIDASEFICLGKGSSYANIFAVIYYMPLIFHNLGLTSTKGSLLATGITGVINVCTSKYLYFVLLIENCSNFSLAVPALLIIDKVGRRPLLFAASAGMLATMVITGGIASKYSNDWSENPSAGWACVVMIWLYIVNFAYGWGPCSWTLIAEIFTLSTRAKGTSIAASANWMNNFAVALMVPSMLKAISW